MENFMVAVKNRNLGYTSYTIADRNVFRSFSPGEVKNISIDELKALQFTTGGDVLLRDCFLIKDEAALDALNMNELEPEYFYTEAEVKVLIDEGSLEQLEDALNFAPDGVIELIKQYSIKYEIPDMRKRKLISEKTGFNIDNAIRVNQIMSEPSDNAGVEESKTQRKAAPVTIGQSAAPTRKAPAPNPNKYKVASH